uniref:RING-type E3 ubiquitin transferase n=1 Tax=Cynoglossus semilaevis TaxID=244447 RepID=A0A3P8VZZ7_CYNSE
MKCFNCGHCAVEKTAKFCCQCGERLQTTPSADTQPKPLEAYVKSEKSEEQNSTQTEDDKEDSRPIEYLREEPDSIQNKRRRKKKKRKKKDDNKLSDHVHSMPEVSFLSMEEDLEKRLRGKRDSFYSETSNSVTDDTLDLPQDGFSLTSQPRSLTDNGPAPVSQDTQLIQSKMTAVTVAQVEEAPRNSDDSSAQRSTDDLTVQAVLTGTLTQQSISQNKVIPPQSDRGKQTKDTSIENKEIYKENAMTKIIQKEQTRGEENVQKQTDLKMDFCSPKLEPECGKNVTATTEVDEGTDANGETNKSKSNSPADSTHEKASADAGTPPGMSDDKKVLPQPDTGKGTKRDSKVHKADRQKTVVTRDQNANEEAKMTQNKQTKGKEKGQKGQGQKAQGETQTVEPGSKMVFGNQNVKPEGGKNLTSSQTTDSEKGSKTESEKEKSETKITGGDKDQRQKQAVEHVSKNQTSSKPVNTGSSVDPDPATAPAQDPSQTSGSDETPNVGNTESSSRDELPTRPTTRNIAANDRVTIYFHGILSKDFKFNPEEDTIFIRAGPPIGTWKENATELSVTKDLGDHGFLVEGTLLESRAAVLSKSIPYKYVVWRHKKKDYEFEFIYKTDNDKMTNRCLFVNSNLLKQEGDWHQYDDIICAAPSKGMLKRIMNTFRPDQRKDLIKGRTIAGNIMLDTIFDLLRSWSETNLRSFVVQLRQFFKVFSEPFVYEETHKKWDSLNYGKDEVKELLKNFMLRKLIPQLLKDGNGQMCYIQDPLKAAVIMLSVCKEYGIWQSNEELNQLCNTLHLPKLGKDFQQYWADFSKDVSVFKDLPKNLLDVINSVKKMGTPRWILVLPLLHLLRGNTKPFQTPSSGSAKYGLTWAGLQGLEMGHSPTLYSQERKALMNILNSYSYLMEVDVLLVRSCLYLFLVDDLKEFLDNINVELLDVLNIFTFKMPQDIYYTNFQAVSDILSHVQSRLIESKYSLFTDAYRRECLTAAVKLLEKICKEVKNYSQNFAAGIPVACMNMVASISDFVQCNVKQEAQEENEEDTFIKHAITEAMGIMRDWINRSFNKQLISKSMFSTAYNKDEIELWNNILSIRFYNEDITTEWRLKFTMDFEGKYKKESALDQIQFYCTKIEELSVSHPLVSESIERCALDAVTCLCQTKTEGRLFERMEINWKFGKLISAIIEKSWPQDCQGHYEEDEEVVLQHFLSWTAAREIFKIYGAGEKLFEKLSEEAKERLAIAISSLSNIKHQLVSGDIKISLLNVIRQRKQAFLDLMKIDGLSENDQYKDNAKMSRLLQCREDEVMAVYHEKRLLEVFLTMSQKLDEFMTVDVACMENKQSVNVESMPLNDFMEVHQFEQLTSDMAGVVTYFSLDEYIRKMAEALLIVSDSYIFTVYWEKQARRWVTKNLGDEDDDSYTQERPEVVASPNIIHDEIFKPCYADYKDIYTRLKDGSIILQEVNELLGVFKGQYEKLAQELDIMCRLYKSAEKQWIHNRIHQIEQYHELHLAGASAQIIIKVKETLCLQGDFRVLETLTRISHADFETEQLNRIDNDLMQAKKVLVDITEPRRLCLQELTASGHFIKWVKEAFLDISELKVFVDLASISAGENDMDVARVACFHDAVLGYSSMLYELKSDSGFTIFKEVVQKLWKALENDSNLPKKLKDSARHLEWLRTVKDSHGSVELSSLSLATAINNKGIYVISAHDVKMLRLDTVVRLQISEKDDEGTQTRWYSLEDLRELQNKLMLMSGKGEHGQHEVDHFAEVFANVQRLAEAFIALHVAGNPLFRNWEAHIRCCLSTNEPGIMMEFNLNSVVSTVIVDGSIEEHLPELCRKMEKCLEYWMAFVNKQRSQFYYLNYYTDEQIIYLCSRLTQQNLTSVNDQVLMMLSFVKQNCTVSDLREVWHALQYKILTEPQDKNEDIEFQTFVVLPSHDAEDLEFTSLFDGAQSIVERRNTTQKFDLIWNGYRKDMQNFLPQILDMRTLGQLLELLASREMKDSKEDSSEGFRRNFTQRQLPKRLVTGNPNLIICPQDEVLTSCISIYMSSNEESLPTYDEVLLCNSSTSYEQVELFLRRCLCPGYKGEKIYTLLYGELLSYDVSYKLETFFQRIKLQSRPDYRLVIICSSEREHAYLPSVFSQYRLHMVPQEPMERIQKYLCKHYTVPAHICSAAAAFKDRLRVGIISSKRAGVGKSLYIKRLYSKLKESTKKPSLLKCIRLIEPKVDENDILQSLLETTKSKELTIFHFDVTSSVQKGLHEFLFKLLVLGYLMDCEGKMWKCNPKHLYVVEILVPTVKANISLQGQTANNTFIYVFPNITCQPPKDVLMLEMKKQEDPSSVNADDPLMDDKEFKSAAFQRPYQYLTRFHNGINLDGFTYKDVEGSHVQCLQMLLVYCGIMDPSWAELRNFAWFLNIQLQDCEGSVFCDAAFTGDTLAGFKTFVVDFMILMAKDFATPSLSISDQSPGRTQVDLTGVKDEDLAPFLIRKRWETEPHPYIFFNDDHVSMTFIGFHLQVNEKDVDAIHPTSGKVIRKKIMTRQLYEGLQLQRVPFNIDFDQLTRAEKIERICNVLGIQWPLDPDETYELTTDNILKMLAIHMRFRCGIPVIIMGETGCGKTRLIKFLCELRRSGVATENMKLVKVHGGTSSEMIYSKIREAEVMASINKTDYGFDSVLFFDEANTTEAISSIKEVLCDNTVKGDSLTSMCGLQIIAACNPYRKHTDEMIKRLESAGLGYRVRAEETDEKLGSIPLRQLVYRVQALPPSMIPLVWDFGQLNDQTEKIYIQQIVQRVTENKAIEQNYMKWITNVLSASQRFMRTRKDECSFVSLRDVERCMQAFVWFYENHVMLFSELKEHENKQKKKERYQREARDPVIWSLVMAIGVCYHACLEDKDKYRQEISDHLPPSYDSGKVQQEIAVMQDLLLSGVPMGDTIARNGALKENVFMMVLCIELRIPLFLVGKPGSSKSLSKTLVADAMKGQAAHSDLYKKLKQIHLVSFQCSPHSTPEGIINTFKQCGRFQEGKNLNEYISVVVLDEIGLAEDSPKMPLKTLHPLLEEGCIDDEPLPHKKVGFIGISNWALDPAKMNRGIFVSRGDPDERELIKSAKGICSSDAVVLEKVRDVFKPFAKAYLNICHEQGKGFFGLRDFYSLIKMLFAVAKVTQQKPTPEETIKAVLRNFSGRDDVDAVSLFTERLQISPNLENINAIEFVRENIQSIGQEEECRYLLVLTKNFAALQILQQTFFSERNQPEIIFGSSFPKDQEYTQICRNINRVKICMETGQTVVLLNLQNLYESLYDALNQYYVYLGGQKYVDLGLGTHRVKCRVHNDFRLIVIEEKEIVYRQFPIPLINRLEKHYLDIHTVLTADQKRMVVELERWVKLFVTLGSQNLAMASTYKYQPPDVFIGYHSDTCASVILQVIEKEKARLEISDPDKRALDEAKLVLLKCATPDSVVRLDCTDLPKVESENLANVYFEKQKTSCFADYLRAETERDVQGFPSFTEVTTFSRLLTTADLKPLEQMFLNVELLSLQQFDTEHSFLKKIRTFLTTEKEKPRLGHYKKILIIQCDFDETTHSANLIASAKYSSINEINKIIQEGKRNGAFLFFITRLPRMEGGTSYVGFHGGRWRSVHIDDLRLSKDIVSDIKALQNMTISQMFETKICQPDATEEGDMYIETEEMEVEESGLENLLDTTALLRSCVQSAVGMLRDRVDSGLRSTQRVEILLTLLSDDDSINGEFLQYMKKHLYSLLANHENNSFKTNWVIKEASNIDALQEGGTFRHTLWKRIQAVVIPLMAQLVSVIDRDHNLDILLDSNCGDSLKRLWLDLFSHDKFLEIPQIKVDNNSETKTILVQNYIAQDKNLSCSMPFSWRIMDFLEELWVHTLQHEGHTQKDFVGFFWKTPLGRYIAKANPEMQIEYFQRYLQDFISMTMNVTCQGDVQLLRCALNCCVNEVWSKLNEKETIISLPWVHVAYHEFKNRLQNLSRMICIEPDVTSELLKNPYVLNGVEMVLDVFTAFACVEYLEPVALNTEAERQNWLRKVKKLQVPIELICSEDSVKEYGQRSKEIVYRVQAGWNRLFSMSLFVENMFNIDDTENKLIPLVLEHTKTLGQILEKTSDLKTQQSFEEVIRLLKMCKDEAVERIFRFGLKLCTVCMGDPQDPLCLPCEHVYCVACIRQWLVPGQMYCPFCMQPVEDDFPIVPSDDMRVLFKRHARFRKQCNTFFIDLVSNMCFKDNSPPSSAVIHDLLSFLLVETNTVPNHKGNTHVRTKMLSPFDECMDKNPVVRSVVLKLLLKYSFEKVKDYLQVHLKALEKSQILEGTNKIELYCLYINCLEDSMFEMLHFRTTAQQQKCLQEESSFLTDYLQSRSHSAETVTVEYLQQVARVRMDLDMAAGLITENMRSTDSRKGEQSVTTAFMTSVVNLCRQSENDWYRVYLIRKISSQYGVEFALKLLRDKEMSWLFPKEALLKREVGPSIDQFLVCGEDYKAFRNAITTVMLRGQFDQLDETYKGCRTSPQLKTVYLLLALYREVTTLYREADVSLHPKPELIEELIQNIDKFLGTQMVKTFAKALLTNQLGPLTLGPRFSSSKCVLLDLTFHLAAVLISGNQGILVPLQQLAHAPANMQAAFLPTMPEDMLAVAQQVIKVVEGRVTWYLCPNGHYCIIGECGMPMETSLCLDCKAQIGGHGHKSVPNFHAAQIGRDRTESGHILGSPTRRGSPDMLDTKSMSPVPFNVVRMLTHMAMLFGTYSQPESISAIIKPRVNDPAPFLLAHLQEDLKYLITSLGKGTDETVSTVHLLINSLMERHQQQWPAPYDNQLSTKEKRNGWEMEISNAVIVPELTDLDRKLKEANTFIHSDARISANPIMKLVFGDPCLFLASLPKNSLLHGSAVWSCREKISLRTLFALWSRTMAKTRCLFSGDFYTRKLSFAL